MRDGLWKYPNLHVLLAPGGARGRRDACGPREELAHLICAPHSKKSNNPAFALVFHVGRSGLSHFAPEVTIDNSQCEVDSG